MKKRLPDESPHAERAREPPSPEPEKRPSKREGLISLHPLDFETALRGALDAGPYSDRKSKPKK
jgi:hypothetical protein